jgi:hypothetical protein
VPRSRWLNLELLDSSGEPLARRRYAIEFGGHSEQRGELDDEGRLSLPVPNGSGRASLVVAHRRLDLALVGLPEADTVEGAQERLNQLNFFVGNVDGALGRFTAEALRRFQRAYGLAPTGELDPDAVDHLQREHGT